MWYRQYGGNTARVVGPFSPEHILAAAELVVGHYQIVLGSWSGGATAVRAALEDARDRAETFLDTVTSSRAVLERYANALNHLSPLYIWWWCVAHPDLEEMWRD
jgi:hypothetical protein